MYRSERHFGLRAAEVIEAQDDAYPASEEEIRAHCDKRAAEWLQAQEGEVFTEEGADKMIGWIIATIIVICFALTLSACGGGGEPQTESTALPVACHQGNTTGVCS